MGDLLKNIRFYILLSTLALSAVVYGVSILTIPAGSLRTIRLDETYGLLALLYLYISLLIGPLCYVVRSLPFKSQIMKARRAIGVSVFYFAFLHNYIAFFGQLHGFAGLAFLSNNYLFAIIIGFVALIILFLLAITSLDYAVMKMTFPKWKLLHRFIYFAAFLVLIHTFMLGTHFSNLKDPLAQIAFAGVAVLLLFEGNRFDAFLQKKFSSLPRFGITIVIIIGLLMSWIIFSFIPQNTIVSFGIHAQHIQLAKDALNNQTNSPISALQGDKNLRYTVSIDKPENISPNQDVTLHFKIYNTSNGNPTSLFRPVYEKPMHLIIVNNQLNYFAHIHPTQEKYEFTVTTQFPSNGLYRLYLNFQPFGAIEQQVAFTIRVGISDDEPVASAQQPVDTTLTKTFGNYEVTLNTHGKLYADQMTLGQQTITFTVKDAQTKKPITTLKPYLAAFGHLVMIDEKTHAYLHIHPTNLTRPPSNANAGPNVEFLPIGIYGPFKPGIYRAFAQFNPDGNLFTADFTIQIN